MPDKRVKHIAEKQDLLVVGGRMSLGYGIIPKLAMKDSRLTIEAKAIYSYFCSYAGAGTTAFPGRDRIIGELGISKDRYYRHFNLLLSIGYLSVEQKSDSNGTFSHNIYTLNETIEKDSIPPCPQNKDTAPCPYNPDTDNKDTISNSLTNNNTGVINNSIDMIDMTDARAREEKINELRETVRRNISYPFIKKNWRKNDIELADELVELMLDSICTGSSHIKIGGEDKPKEIVASRYLGITIEEIEYVINNFRMQKRKITNISRYLKTMLYNAKYEISHKYENEAIVMFSDHPLP